MSTSDDGTETARIAAFRDKVAAQTFRVRTLHGSAIQKAQDRRLLDAMRQNEVQAILNRTLARNADDSPNMEGAKAAE